MSHSIYLSEVSATSFTLDDKLILVTGAGAGIGREVCLQGAEAGATIIMLDKSQAALDSLYDEIVCRQRPEPIQVTENLAKAKPKQWDALCSQINAAYGKLDGLIHCAAEAMPLTPLEHMDFEDWQKTLYTNLTSPWLLTRSLLPLLKKSENASIVFSSGEAGRSHKAYWNATGITWGALDSMTRIWHEELEANHNIRINSLDPGAVNTSMRSRLFPAENPANINQVETVAKVYLYLLCDASSEISGKSLTFSVDELVY